MRRALRRAAVAGIGAGALMAPLLAEVRFARSSQPLTRRWATLPVRPRGSTRLGLSFRPLQAASLGLDPHTALKDLLEYPFEMIRLGAYWNQIERERGHYCTDDLDRQLDLAEAAGKQVILCVGAVKTFGYPEFFVPRHQLRIPLPEGVLVEPGGHGDLLAAAVEFVTYIVERYKDRDAVVAWQVEHEAVDPLGMEHSWRLSTSFVRREVGAVRTADPTRPVMMNGFLATSIAVGVQQWARTRDQGDSLDVAGQLADIVGVDFYPRHALVSVGQRTIYLDGSRRSWQQRRRRSLLARAAQRGQQVIVCEGQAEPWETATVPPNPSRGRAMYSCRPEHLVDTYNQTIQWNEQTPSPLLAYLFWGAEYWLARRRNGDSSYLNAFRRILEAA